MEKLTNTELAILGLVSETPKHAYRLEQEIEARGMRQWTEIGFSSIYYVLNKLEKAGWLASDLRTDGNGPARRVYHLTHAGWDIYRGGVESRLASPRPRTGDFILGLANLPALSPAVKCRALRTYHAFLRKQLEEVRLKQASDHAASLAVGQALAEHVDSLFDYATSLIEAEYRWVEAFLEKNECEDELAG
jgi:DNA-binding PadR family transcriptional regulator